MRLVKAKAKELMLARENHLLLIFSLIVIGVTEILPQMVFSIIYAFFPYLIVDIALIIVSVLFIAPLLYGVLRISFRLANGEDCTIADLFEAFYSSEDYWRSILAAIVLLVIAAAETALLAIPVALADTLAGVMTNVWVSDIIGIVGLLGVLFGLLLLNGRMLLFPMLVAKGNGVWRAMELSLSMTRGKTLKILGYSIGFLPLVAVSVILVLVPMVIYTAPYMLCVYAIGVKMMCENNNE